MTLRIGRRRSEADSDELRAEIKHDYATGETGIVPLDRRRSMPNFIAIWATFSAGYSVLFVGFELFVSGYDLLETIGITSLGIAIYWVYAMPASYLGSRSGQTHSLLTRSIFGVLGSWIVSAMLVVGPMGSAGFQAGLMVQIWNGLYGWGHVEVLTVVFAFLMVQNNVFGFTGIAVFARWIVTPLLVLWIGYIIVKAVVSNSGALSYHPHGVGLAFWAAVGLVIGFNTWGNEPDIWRYGRPRFWWPAPPYIFGNGMTFLFFTIGGWVMARLAHSSDEFGVMVSFGTQYGLFGFTFLAFLLATLSQYAINDGNYYETINGLQNLFGSIKRWRRIYSCVIAGCVAAFMGWVVNYGFVNGYAKLAAVLAIFIPCATTIMVVDHFVLPKLFRVSRPLTVVPSWTETAPANWPGVVALVISVAWGGYATGLWPGEKSTTYIGPAPPDAWILAAALYVVGVGILHFARARDTEGLRGPLGVSRVVPAGALAGDRPVDLASVAESTSRGPEVPTSA